ncbi:MAG: glucose 1-dehydrogenase [Clostridiales Family XIII bacterium]|jgi:3-oxoacyl-[acyl-carrier protein] reductase|nr:glucose 1-dehydrogenase [Clostridiales Family XIII bacterium]
MFGVSGKTTVITGAAQGIGREFALAFAKEGSKIVVTDINGEKAERVAKEIKDAGGEAFAHRLDITDLPAAEAMAKKTKETFGSFDILINSAAIFSTIKMKPFYEMSIEEYRQVIDVNMTGTLIACKAAAPYMMEQKWGRVINLTSCSFFEGRGGYVHYVSSKAGVIGITRAVARELGGFNVTSNAIAPGATVTEVPRETVNEEWKKKVMANRCVQRTQVPEDLVGIALFMASEEAAFMTGQTVVVDGGMIFLP